MKNNIDYSLYLCTDRELMSTKSLEQAVEQAILGGCTVVQLREKNCSSREFYETAISIKKITDSFKIPLIINDRVDISMAVDADGVHIGQSDLPADTVRKIIGDKKILGVSVSTEKESLDAMKNGADYLGIGAMFSTDTKKDAKIVTMDTLRTIRNSVNIPIVVIGGINKDNAGSFLNMGINGIAVVSAIISQKDIKKSASELLEIFKKGSMNIRRVLN